MTPPQARLNECMEEALSQLEIAQEFYKDIFGREALTIKDAITITARAREAAQNRIKKVETT